MGNKEVLYKNPNFDNFMIGFVFYFILSAIIIFIPLTIFYINSKLYLNYPYMIIPIILSFLFPFWFIYRSYHYSYWYDINKYYIENISSEINYKLGDNYAGIIIANDNQRFYKYFTIYNGCILLIIEYLKNRDMPLKIVNFAKKKDLDKMIYDEKCTELYIFGHGGHSYLRINKKDTIDYSKYSDAPNKTIVEQLHCDQDYLLPFIHRNEAKKPSLTETLNAKREFKTGRLNTCSDLINFGLNKLMK